jgi:hypothetical protein
MKKSTISITTITVLTMFLVSCSLLPGSRPASESAMQTEIAQILTAMVTETEVPLIELPPTEEPIVPTEVIIEPTEPPVLDITPTMEIGQLITSTPEELVFESTPVPLPDEGNPPATLEAIPTSHDFSTTPTVASTPTQTANDPILALGSPTWKDTFDNGDNWPLGIDKFVDLKSSGGTLQMIGFTNKNGWRLSNQKAVNFYLQLTGKMSVCSGADHYGLFFRVPNLSLADRGYLFGISCDGKFALRKWSIDTMTVLENWKSNDAILKGSNQTNRLGIMAKGNELKLYINGVLVDTIKDTSFSQGYIGLYVGPKETTKLTALLDEIAYWIIQ